MKTVAFLTSADGIEQAELTEPWRAIKEAGHRPVLIANTADGQVQAYHHRDRADRFSADLPVGQADAADYSALVLPGGVANGDALRGQPAAVELVRAISARGVPVAVICHGGWVLIEAGIVRGRTLTSWPTLQTDYRNAGASWVDQELVVDDEASPTLISSRKPDDLPAFCAALVDALKAA
jgi:protease I